MHPALDVPELRCPITHEVMSRPVVAFDGFTYEHDAMARYLELGGRTSPYTGAPLVSTALFPNRAMERLIAALQGAPEPAAPPSRRRRVVTATQAAAMPALLALLALAAHDLADARPPAPAGLVARLGGALVWLGAHAGLAAAAHGGAAWAAPAAVLRGEAFAAASAAMAGATASGLAYVLPTLGWAPLPAGTATVAAALGALQGLSRAARAGPPAGGDMAAPAQAWGAALGAWWRAGD